MARHLLLIGFGPWPFIPNAKMTGPNIRLSQFFQPLQSTDFQITCLLIDDSVSKPKPLAGFADVYQVPLDFALNPARLFESLSIPNLTAIVGVGSLAPNLSAVRCGKHLNLPSWVDFFGDPLSELHASQCRISGKLSLEEQSRRDQIWLFFRECLESASAFSVINPRQQMALIGQLLLLGRFSKSTTLEDVIHIVRIGVPEGWTEPTPVPPWPTVLSKHGLSHENPYLILTGSWNVWLDELKMTEILQEVLTEFPHLFLVCAGQAMIHEGNTIRDAIFSRLEIAKDRIIHLDGLESENEAALIAHAKASILIDRPIPESYLGSRNRLLASLRWGLPTFISPNTFLAQELCERGLAFDQPAIPLLQEILSWNEETRRDFRAKSLSYMKGLTFGETTKPIVAWLKSDCPTMESRETDGLIDRWATLEATPETFFPENKSSLDSLKRFLMKKKTKS